MQLRLFAILVVGYLVLFFLFLAFGSESSVLNQNSLKNEMVLLKKELQDVSQKKIELSNSLLRSRDEKYRLSQLKKYNYCGPDELIIRLNLPATNSPLKKNLPVVSFNMRMAFLILFLLIALFFFVVQLRGEKIKSTKKATPSEKDVSLSFEETESKRDHK